MKRLLSANPKAEARAQGILLDRLDRAFAARVQAEINGATLSMIDEYAATGADPAVPMMHLSRMTQLYTDMAAISVDAFGGRVMDAAMARTAFTRDGGKSFEFAGGDLRLEAKGFAEFFQRLALEFIQGEAIRQRITSVTAYTRTLVLNAIDRGQRDGLGVDAIARDMRERSAELSRVRAHTIARTETHGAANYGAMQAAKATGLSMRKEWISVKDHRTRDFGQGDGVIDEYDHRAMNGQIVPIDQPFSMPWRKGDPLKIMNPGDPDMPAGAVINCRCAVGFIVDD